MTEHLKILMSDDEPIARATFEALLIGKRYLSTTIADEVIEMLINSDM